MTEAFIVLLSIYLILGALLSIGILLAISCTQPRMTTLKFAATLVMAVAAWPYFVLRLKHDDIP